MSGFLIPNYIFGSVFEITPEFLKSINITGLIIDIDNTLVTYSQPHPTPQVEEWLSLLSQSGVALSLVSNNGKERVELFNRDLKLFASYDSAKPSRRGLRAAMAHMGCPPSETAVIGDQIFTDVLAAKRAKITAMLVKPIEYKETVFFKAKRALERPFIRAYYKKHKNQGTSHKS